MANDPMASFRGFSSIGKGSIPTVTANTTCSNSRDAAISKGQVLATHAGTPGTLNNNSIVRERYLFRQPDPTRLNNENYLDHNALTRPWDCVDTIPSEDGKYPEWPEDSAKRKEFQGRQGNLFQSGDGSDHADHRKITDAGLEILAAIENRH